MAVYRRGNVWWYKFTFNGEPIRASTKQTNKRTAEQMEAAHKTRLAKGEVGIEDKKQAPTLAVFADRFRREIAVRCAEKPRMVSFYNEKLQRLLEYPRLANSRLDRIKEELIEDYVQHRRLTVCPATVNRQLATLRRALRLAYKWEIIDRLPKIVMLPGERSRDFVLSPAQEKLYLTVTPELLRDLAILLLDTGMRISEALDLQWPDIPFEPALGARAGYLQVKSGKSKNARRNLSLTARAHKGFGGARGGDNDVLGVFQQHRRTISRDLHRPHTPEGRVTLKLPGDFVVHSFRRTMLTRLGETGTDAFTIMRIAGHSSVTVSEKYVHPTPETIERAFERLEAVHAVGTDSGTVAKVRKPVSELSTFVSWALSTAVSAADS